MAQTLGDMQTGSILYLKEAGKDSAYYVYAHNYEQTRNGQGFTLLLRKNKSDKAYGARSEKGFWFGEEKNNVQLELDKLYETWFDEDTKAAIETTKYPVTVAGKKDDVRTIESKLFVFSSVELNIIEQSGLYENALVGENLNGPAQYVQSNTWVRDNPEGSFVVNFVYIKSTRSYVTHVDQDSTQFIQPILCIKGSHPVTEDGHLKFNDPPTAPGSIDVSGVVRGGSATITLTAATDPDGTVASYIFERQVDGGAWEQVAQANSLTQTDPIGEDWGTVAYRACAVGEMGVSGPYVTGETYTINSGWVTIGGPAEDMGSQPRRFDFAFSVSVSGVASVDAITVSVARDGTRIYSGTPSAAHNSRTNRSSSRERSPLGPCCTCSAASR